MNFSQLLSYCCSK